MRPAAARMAVSRVSCIRSPPRRRRPPTAADTSLSFWGSPCAAWADTMSAHGRLMLTVAVAPPDAGAGSACACKRLPEGLPPAFVFVGEIVALAEDGRPVFNDLLFGWRQTSYVAEAQAISYVADCLGSSRYKWR